MRYLPEFGWAAALMILGLLSFSIVTSEKWGRRLRWAAGGLAVAICIGGLLLRGATGRGVDDYAGEALVQSICQSVRLTWLCEREENYSGGGEVGEAWKIVKDSTDPSEFKLFIEKFKGTIFADWAAARLGRLDDAAWAEVRRYEKISDARSYLERWSEGKHVEEARILIDRLDSQAWQQALSTKTAAGYRSYIVQWPTGQQIEAAKSAIAALDDAEWQASQTGDRLAKALSYLKEWPDGRHAKEVTTFVGAAGVREWQEVEGSKDLAKIDGFIRNFPESPLIETARANFVEAFLRSPKKSCPASKPQKQGDGQSPLLQRVDFDVAQGIPRSDHPKNVNPDSPPPNGGGLDFLWGGDEKKEVKLLSGWAPGTVIVSWCQGRLFFVTNTGEGFAYPIARVSPQSVFIGRREVSAKEENPSWTPTDAARSKNARLPAWVPGGHPMNPLGVRVLRFKDSKNDDDTIHGTDSPWTIGLQIDGLEVRMLNEHVIDLYSRVPKGTKVLFHTADVWHEVKAKEANRSK